MVDPKPTMLFISPLREWIVAHRYPDTPDTPYNRGAIAVLDLLEQYITAAERGFENG